MCVQVNSSKVIELRNFSIGLPKIMKYRNDKEISTGICKQTTEEAFLKKEGFLGDGVWTDDIMGVPDPMQTPHETIEAQHAFNCSF